MLAAASSTAELQLACHVIRRALLICKLHGAVPAAEAEMSGLQTQLELAHDSLCMLSHQQLA